MKRILLTIFLVGCTTAPKHEPSKFEALRAQGRKSVVWFNKKHFERGPGAFNETVSATAHAFARKAGGHAEPLENINGFRMELPADAPLQTGGDWIMQEEVEYRVPLQTKLYKIEEAQCPTNPTQPTCPVCPVCPNPPAEPWPEPEEPTQPIEQARSWGVTRMKALEAKTLVDTSNVKVCVVDTGIDQQHPNNGVVVASATFAGGTVQDRQGHGTHVAGTVAGTGGIGVSKAKLYICKGLSDNGSGTSSSLAQCLNWCGQQRVDIVSNSWGSTQSDAMIAQGITRLAQAGIAVVIANGNDSRGQLNYPARQSINSDMIFGIAASDQQDRKANFSTYGPGTDYIAPGVQIVSSVPGGKLEAFDGTSMATPGVAGALAYCKAMGKPYSCLKTDNLGLSQSMQGLGLPNLLKTVQQ